MSIKLVVINIDGALLNSQHEITPRAKEMLQKANEQGVRIVLCIGRPLLGVKEQLDELALYGENDFMITCNGLLVQATKDSTIISRCILGYEDFLEIETYPRKVGTRLHTIDDSTICTANRNIGEYAIRKAPLVNMSLKYHTVNKMTPEMNIVKMMMIDEPEVLDPAIAKLPLHFTGKYTTIKSTSFYHEITNESASKGNALAKLANRLGLNKDEVMTVDDSENDLSMIDYAEISIMMSNTTESVKIIADMHTTSNDKSGIAQIIEKMVLI